MGKKEETQRNNMENLGESNIGENEGETQGENEGENIGENKGGNVGGTQERKRKVRKY